MREEPRICKLAHPVIRIEVTVIVVYRVSWSRICTHINCSNSAVDEARVVTPRTKYANGPVGVVTPDVIHCRVAFESGPKDFLHEILSNAMQLWGGRDIRVRTRHSNIDIQIGNNRLLDPWQVLLHPFCRSDQAIFFSIPACKHDGTLRLPALCKQFAEHTTEFDNDGCSTVGVRSTTNDPGISMVANDDSLVGACAVDDADGVPDVYANKLGTITSCLWPAHNSPVYASSIWFVRCSVTPGAGPVEYVAFNAPTQLVLFTAEPFVP